MLKVAFASVDRQTVDQHFGAAEGFAVYALDADRAQLLEVIEFPPETMDGNENKLPAKVQSLSGCDAVYCLAAGASAVRQLLAAGIQPIRLDDTESIEPLLNQLRKAIKDGDIPWVQQALMRAVKKQASDADRFDKMAEEGWDE